MKDLTLKETKNLLGISDNSKDSYIHEMLPIVIMFVRDKCEDSSLPIEGGVRIAVVKIIEFYMNNSSIQNKSLSRLKETFLTELPTSILDLLKPYDKSDRIKFL